MKKYFLISLLIIGLSLTNTCIAIDNSIQISDKDKQLYKLRQNKEYGIYAGDMSLYNADYTDKADSFLKQGNIEKANKYINLALYYYDSNPLSYVIKGELDLLNNNIDGAKSNYQKAIDIIESDLDRYNSSKCNSLWVRIDKGYIKIAIKENDILTASDKIDTIRANWTHFDTEIIRLEAEISKKAGEILKSDERIKLSKLQNNIADVLDNIDLKIKKNPKDSQAYYDKAMILYGLFKENDFALYYVNEAIEISKQSKYLLLKSQLVEDKQTQLNLINEAIKLNPVNNPEVYSERANYYYDEENYALALEDYLKAIKYGGNEKDYAEQIGWCYFENEDFEQSLKYFVISGSIGGQADSLLNLGKYQEALELYKKIVGNPDYDQDVVKSNMNICKKNLHK